MSRSPAWTPDRIVTLRRGTAGRGRTQPMTRLWTTLALAVVLAARGAGCCKAPESSRPARAEGSAAMQASRFDDAAAIYAELVAASQATPGC